ncbi:MAG: protein kinase [bacterium]
MMIGKSVSHYKILEKIGSGGMGTVYKAQDTKLDRFVALKFLPPHLSQSGEEKKRFIHEAKAASALQHNNICTIHEINEIEDDQMYIVMDCYEGESLKDKIDCGPLPMEEALDIALQIARGLEKAHAKGIVHRDIKPANVLITEDGIVKIVDFGLAKLAGRTMLTKEGTTLGTVAYMSPEQTQGTDIDQRTDIWALGVILYEMLGGERPFKGDYEQAVIYSIMNEEPEALEKINSDIPNDLEKIILQTLTKKPADRYQTIKDLQKDLEVIAGVQTPLKSRSAGKSIFAMKKTYVFTGLMVLLLLLGLNIGGIRNWIMGGNEYSSRSIRMAVLPFANLTGDPEQEYLCDGFTQEMILKLGGLHPENLSVIARSSIMRYKAGNTPVDQIGKELDVGYVLEGSTRLEGDVINISAELIRVTDQTQLWSNAYTRKIQSVLHLQSEVAKRIAETLALKLLPGETTSLAAARDVDPEAYEAYLKGSNHWKKLTPAGCTTAEQYFNLALEKDSLYAAAYEGLAWVWIVRQQMGITPPQEAGPKAREAAKKALALNERFAGAHEALAVVRTWVDWDWDSARQSWQRALELNPNKANAQAYYAHFLMIMGEIEKAVLHSKKAVELDPFNPFFHAMRGMVLSFARRWDEARVAADTALALQPSNDLAKGVLRGVLLGIGKLKEHHDKLMAEQLELHGNDEEWVGAFERGMAEGGYTCAQRRIADLLAYRYETFGWQGDNVRAENIARRYYDAGDIEETLDWLEKAYEERDPNLPYDVRNPFYYDSLRTEPRFRELLRKMNLPVGDMK